MRGKILDYNTVKNMQNYRLRAERILEGGQVQKQMETEQARLMNMHELSRMSKVLFNWNMMEITKAHEQSNGMARLKWFDN